jgi:hypothetical protein
VARGCVPFYERQARVTVKEKIVKSVPEVKKKICSRGGVGSSIASGCSVYVCESADILVSASLAGCVTMY